jgi:O-acetyl-ADP-ribose deacetylase (regulator of RNase III)
MKVQLKKADITTLSVDAIVNAANSSLLGGGGVDGAIHRAGGPAILAECRQIRNRQGGCKTGEAVITTAGRMPARYVIHTVGPVWRGGSNGEAELLRSCYEKSLQLAEDHELTSVAFPNISTGIYGFPKERAAEIAVEAVRNHHPSQVREVYFVCFDAENHRLYSSLLD